MALGRICRGASYGGFAGYGYTSGSGSSKPASKPTTSTASTNTASTTTSRGCTTLGPVCRQPAHNPRFAASQDIRDIMR